MKTSLVSREFIADSVELVARGHLFDTLVVIGGCDKTIPATTACEMLGLAPIGVGGIPAVAAESAWPPAHAAAW